MKLEKAKNWAKEHKRELAIGGATLFTGGIIGGVCNVIMHRNNGTWNRIIPFNTDDFISFVKKWKSADKYDGEVVIGLRNVDLTMLQEKVKEAFAAASLDENTVLGQVVLTTIKEEK